MASKFWIGFEQVHKIYRYGDNLRKLEAQSQPKILQALWNNGGIEALARLDDGCFLAIAEVEERVPARAGLRGVAAYLFNADPAEQPDHVMPFRYDSEGKGRVTDAQQLPDGRIIILHREVTFPEGFVSTLAIADLESIGPNDVMTSKTIARIARPSIADNFEGLAVVTEPAGRDDSKADDWYVWLLSDDNLMGFERTYLIKYKIDRTQLQ